MKKIKNYFFYCSLKILHCKKLFNHLTVRSMQKINLSGIIAQQKLSEKDIAKQLFPTNKYPKLALSRVLRNEATLDADQISRLAALLNCTISELYSCLLYTSDAADDLTRVDLGG